MEDIPIKLRCAICNKLALNAFRLPCCDQSICETCQSALPDTCPVCEHSPVAADDCKPHKALRTTIKVFLKTEEKKRESRGRSESINTMPVTNGTPLAIAEPAKDQPPSSTPAPTSRAGEKDLADTVDQREEISMQESAQSQTRGSETLEAEKDIPRPSTEV
ncbi:hypothetical protein L228DRAFT_156564 [Xylona heveae TC161]|uniref:RING-type domain-containing protein n=1 Tax=Xylona heveae (strain CBS 132557 / TC161) TaxID=1328760 RepID=A0A165G183_XYLHT|nr:hypothetical protein L228DRAFT_156564 [Xylona heveae TC161]KZF21623.1 hypothetical protein L228DRAFT_156564 [Xylona heveae TC161]